MGWGSHVSRGLVYARGFTAPAGRCRLHDSAGCLRREDRLEEAALDIAATRHSPLRRPERTRLSSGPVQACSRQAWQRRGEGERLEGWLLPDRPQPQAGHGTAGRAEEALVGSPSALKLAAKVLRPPAIYRLTSTRRKTFTSR